MKAVRCLHRGHIWLGLFSSLVLTCVAITGLLLQYTDGLRLDQYHTTQSWLLRRYGITAPPVAHGFHVGSHWVMTVGNKVAFDECLLSEPSPLVGAITAADGMYLAFRDQLILVHATGEVLERAIPPGPIDQIGTDYEQRLYLRVGHSTLTSDDGAFTWRPVAPATQKIQWSAPSPADSQATHRAQRAYLRSALNWERVMLDLHTGRLFGAVGVLAVAAAGTAVPLLAVSGLTLWVIRMLRRHHQHRSAE